MIRVAPVARWTAIAIAVAAVLDPAIPIPTRARPGLRVTGHLRPVSADGYGAQGDRVSSLRRQLGDAGFALHETQNEAATVFVGDAPPDARGGDAPPDARGGDAPPDARGGDAPPDARGGDAPPDARGGDAPPEARGAAPIWALDLTPGAPNVRIARANGSTVRFPGQAVDVVVGLDARGMAGKTSEVVLEDAGIRVASLRHEWKSDEERWQGSLQYLPPGAAAGRLRVKAVEIPGETSTDDNAVEIAIPPLRGGIRTLVVEAGVTWPALFVRRAIEGEPAFAVAALQRATPRIATRAGAPPSALTRGTLAPFEVALVGAPANLTAGDVEALRWFVEERGGVAVLIPDQAPSGRYLELLGAPQFEPRAVDAAVPLSHGLMTSEFVVARSLPPGSEVLAGTAAGDPVVFSARRGAGAVIFSGALDAWRYRAAFAPPAPEAATAPGAAFAPPAPEGATAPGAAFAPPAPEAATAPGAAFAPPAPVGATAPGTASAPPLSSDGATAPMAHGTDGFARFWRRAIAQEAATVPPILEVSVDPSPVAIGRPARVRARLRATEISTRSPTFDLPLVAARAVSPGAHVDAPVRLWPTAEPGVYEGEWRPSISGDYDLVVNAGPHTGDAAVTVAASGQPAADPEGLALMARASGGRVFRADQSDALVEGLKEAFPARGVTKTMNPMRSPWWAVPFAGLLCVEWALRRRNGNP